MTPYLAYVHVWRARCAKLATSPNDSARGLALFLTNLLSELPDDALATVKLSGDELAWIIGAI